MSHFPFLRGARGLLQRSRALGCAALALALTGCATPKRIDAEALAAELARRPVVLLGEVHDNVVQHRVRADALRRLLEGGARPAIALEQFDRDRQADIDRARREVPAGGQSLADHVITAARTSRDTWDWTQYRPFVELALRHDLPIVAANLSRSAASRVAREGYAAVFDAAEREALRLDRFEALMPQHERIVQEGHCNALPASALPGLARAQVARDAVLAQAIRPHLDRGVILLTGNGHVRRDIGVPRHLSDDERRRVWSIGLLEVGTAERAALFDVAFLTPEQSRPDPCDAFKARRSSKPG